MLKRIVSTLLASCTITLLAAVETHDKAAAAMRLRLAELGHYVIEEAEGRAPARKGPPYQRTPREEAIYQLPRLPREPLREAIDQALRNGNKQERIGAITLYPTLVGPTYGYFEREPLNPAYRRLFYDLIANDDRKLPTYTHSLAGGLRIFPTSRETIFFYMDLAESTTLPKTRENYLLLTADALGIDLPIYKETPPLEREKILSDFEAWFAKNKSHIAFDDKGRSLLAGSKVVARPRALRAEDRKRIRQDPVCLLQLMQATIGNPQMSATTEGLVGKCGEALYGAEAVSLIQEATEQYRAAGGPSLDLQFKIAQTRGKYPVMDAVVLAAAYVAAYDDDPQHRELAKR